jgi:hypothetical protein
MQNTETNPNQTPEAGTIAQLPTRARRRGCRLTLGDARDVAALCAKRCSEAEACATLGIPISSWHHWKARVRNSDEFREILDAIRGAKIQAHLDNIEKASQKDWRASECYLEKTIPDRFARSAASVEINAPVGAIDDATLNKVLAMFKAEKAKQTKAIEIAASVEPKQLPDAKPKNA